jgi:hypothetical protein
MADEADWAPPGVDTGRANVARVYDYWLGGTHNFLADQDVGRAVAAVEPRIRSIAQANRVLQFLADADDPWRTVATLRDALAPGSYLVLCHGTDEGRATTAQAAGKVYNGSVTTEIHMRPRADILRFFDGFDLVDPGLVFIPQWRPDSLADIPAEPGKFWALVGAGRKA